MAKKTSKKATTSPNQSKGKKPEPTPDTDSAAASNQRKNPHINPQPKTLADKSASTTSQNPAQPGRGSAPSSASTDSAGPSTQTLPPPKAPIPITQSRLFRVLVYTLLGLLIVLVANQVSFIFRPIVVLISTLFLPIFLAGIFFYLFNPITKFLVRHKMPITAAILLVYLVIGGALTLAVLYAAPILERQIDSLISATPRLVESVRVYLTELGQNSFFSQFVPGFSDMNQDLVNQLGDLVRGLYSGISTNISGLVGFIANLIIVFTTVPFVLFFMLKDGHKLPRLIAHSFPRQFEPEAEQIMISMGDTLGTYIQGQLLVSSFVGVMVLIGYSIIGLPYALLLALVALVTNLIPYIGPVIGIVPGMVVALVISPAKMVQVMILVFVVQQLESQLIAPLVMGRKLQIHPIIIIFLLLTAGSLAGFLGLLLAVPTYALVRTAWTHLSQLWILRRQALSSFVDDALSGVE